MNKQGNEYKFEQLDNKLVYIKVKTKFEESDYTMIKSKLMKNKLL